MINIINSEVYEVQGPRPNTVTVTWTIGNSCVYKCSYCPKALHDGSNPYHNIDLVLAMFNKLPKDTIVLLMGGEPTYHPDFERIMLEKPDHIRIDMLTNGAKPLAFWQKLSNKFSKLTFTFHPEFANVERFTENALEASKHVEKFKTFLMMVPSRWDYCVEVYGKLIASGLEVSPKVVLENFGSRVDPNYTESQLQWIADTSKNNKSGSFITLYDKDRNVLGKTNAIELLSLGQTNFTGFKCHAPMEHIVINPDKKIFNSRCLQKSQYSNLDSTDFKLPTEPMMCRTSFCKCLVDIITTKLK
jgi:MoaA/NifB/PqqE/SkfB family radical SAM enzyme